MVRSLLERASTSWWMSMRMETPETKPITIDPGGIRGVKRRIAWHAMNEAPMFWHVNIAVWYWYWLIRAPFVLPCSSMFHSVTCCFRFWSFGTSLLQRARLVRMNWHVCIMESLHEIFAIATVCESLIFFGWLVIENSLRAYFAKQMCRDTQCLLRQEVKVVETTAA